MASTLFFILATLSLSLNFVRLRGVAISDWLYLGALGFAIIETLSVQRQHLTCWYRNRFLWMVYLIILGAVLSTTNSRYVGTAITESIQQVFVATAFVSLAWIMVRRGSLKPIALAFIFSGIFTAGIAIIDFVTGSKLGPQLSGTPEILLWGRFAGTLGHPNKLGYFLVLTTLLSVGIWFTAEKDSKQTVIHRIIWMSIIAVQLFGIYLSNSMTAFLGLLFGAILYGIFYLSRTHGIKKESGMYRIVLSILFVVGIILLTGWILNLEFLQSMEENILTAWDRVTMSTAESRLVVYRYAWKRILENPLIGTGNDQISTSGTGLVQSLLGYGVHNIFMQIWYTGGIFALIGWLSIYISIGWSAFKILARKSNQSSLIYGLAITVLTLIVMDQFQDSIYQREKWLVIGLFAGLVWGRQYNISRTKNPQPTSAYLEVQSVKK